MKWFEAQLFQRTQTGIDAVRNPTYKDCATDVNILIRLAPYVPQHHAVDGNGLDVVERTYLTKANPVILNGVTALKVGDVLYDITNIMPSDHLTAIRVKEREIGRAHV